LWKKQARPDHQWQYLCQRKTSSHRLLEHYVSRERNVRGHLVRPVGQIRLSLVLIVGITVGVYLYRMREEEAALSAAFGEAYRAYCRSTKRLIPGLF